MTTHDFDPAAAPDFRPACGAAAADAVFSDKTSETTCADCIACRAGTDSLFGGASPEARPVVPTPGAELLALVNDIATGRRSTPGASPFVPLPLVEADAAGDGRRLSCLSSGLGTPREAKPLPVHIKLADAIVETLRAEKLTPPLRLARCSPAAVESDGQLLDVIKVDFQKDAPKGVAPFCVGNEIEQEYAELLDLSGDLEGLAAELVRGVRVALLNEGELMQPGDVDWLGSSGALHVQRVTKGEI